MAEWRFATEAGDLTLRGWCTETVERARALGVRLAKGGQAHDGWIELGGRPARLSAGPLARRGPLAWVLPPGAGEAPAIRVYIRMCWLVERHFETLLPLAAGAFGGRGHAPYQFLITRPEDPAEPVATLLADTPGEEIAALGDELARELARMHSLGFVHGRLAPDGLLVRALDRPDRSSGPDHTGRRRLVFRDPSARKRLPIERDLAAWTGWISAAHGERFLATYCEQRARQDRPVDARGLARRVERAVGRNGRAPSA